MVTSPSIAVETGAMMVSSADEPSSSFEGTLFGSCIGTERSSTKEDAEWASSGEYLRWSLGKEDVLDAYLGPFFFVSVASSEEFNEAWPMDDVVADSASSNFGTCDRLFFVGESCIGGWLTLSGGNPSSLAKLASIPSPSRIPSTSLPHCRIS
jgi:hypothetical protein